jgi:hypothetical protein
MARFIPPNARLIADVEASRVDLARGDGISLPRIGELVCVDQGLAGPGGSQMYMVYCYNPDGTTKWTADVDESELEPLEPAPDADVRVSN